MMMIHRFILGLNARERNTIREGSVIRMANISIFIGVVEPAPELPFIKFSIRPGTNKEKKSPYI